MSEQCRATRKVTFFQSGCSECERIEEVEVDIHATDDQVQAKFEEWMLDADANGAGWYENEGDENKNQRGKREKCKH